MYIQAMLHSSSILPERFEWKQKLSNPFRKWLVQIKQARSSAPAKCFAYCKRCHSHGHSPKVVYARLYVGQDTALYKCNTCTPTITPMGLISQPLLNSPSTVPGPNTVQDPTDHLYNAYAHCCFKVLHDTMATTYLHQFHGFFFHSS